MAILNIGGMNIDGEQKTIGVSDDMPLAPVDTFAGVVASRASRVGGRSALAVNDRRGQGGPAPSLQRALQTEP